MKPFREVFIDVKSVINTHWGLSDLNDIHVFKIQIYTTDEFWHVSFTPSTIVH